MPEYPTEWVRTSDRRFGGRVRQARENLTLTQRQVAERLAERHGFRWQQTTLAKVETGEKRVRLFEALALADVLGIELSGLVDRPADGDEAQRQQAAELHARMGELDDVTRYLDRRRRQLRGFLATDDGGGGSEDGEHQAPT